MHSFSFPAEIKRNDGTDELSCRSKSFSVRNTRPEKAGGKGVGKRKGGRIVAHIGWATELGQVVFVSLFGLEGNAKLPSWKEGNVSRIEYLRTEMLRIFSFSLGCRLFSPYNNEIYRVFVWSNDINKHYDTLQACYNRFINYLYHRQIIDYSRVIRIWYTHVHTYYLRKLYFIMTIVETIKMLCIYDSDLNTSV